MIAAPAGLLGSKNIRLRLGYFYILNSHLNRSSVLSNRINSLIRHFITVL
jgi:hypothetical protein